MRTITHIVLHDFDSRVTAARSGTDRPRVRARRMAVKKRFFVTKMRADQSALIRGVRLIVMSTGGAYVNIGFEMADGPKPSDVIEIGESATDHDLCLTRLNKSA